MEVVTKPREWGNSLGITIPKEIIQKENIKKGDELIIDIRKKNDIKAIRGLVKFKKSTQELKDEMRKGWQ
jgi:antitoxin component of MazEF toxin-antitoxin module